MNKVVHLARWMLPFTASFIRNQIVHHQRYIPSIVYAEPKEGPFYEELTGKYDSLHPIRSPWERQLYRTFRMLSSPAQKRVKNYIEKKDPDILHVHYGVDCLVYADVLRELKKPTCVSFYGYDCASFPKRFMGYGKTWLQKDVFHNPGVTAILAMSEDMEKDLLELGCPQEKIIVHYYGTETDPFYQERTYPDKEVIDFLIISSFTERKGHGFLLDAFQQLNRITKKKVHLHIVGDGYLKDQVVAKIAETQLDNISLYGPVRYGSREHMDYLKMADVFVHPSVIPADGQKEGIPGAIVEAMAAGLPVISTYHAGIPHIMVHEKSGMLVREYDVAGLAEAMKRVAEDLDLRKAIALEGQDYAIHHLNIKEKEVELEYIYDNLAGVNPVKNGRQYHHIDMKRFRMRK